MSGSKKTPWTALGQQLAAHRVRKGVSKRAAAEAAGFSEATWRQLEAGVRNLAPGHTVEMSARPETVIAAAHAVGMDPAEALRIVGLDSPETLNLADAFEAPAADVSVRQLAEALTQELTEMRTELRALTALMGAVLDRVAPDDAEHAPTGASSSPSRRAQRSPAGVLS